MKLKENYKNNINSAIVLLRECMNLNIINKENIKLATQYILNCFDENIINKFNYNITTIPYISTYDFKEKVNIKEEVFLC